MVKISGEQPFPSGANLKSSNPVRAASQMITIKLIYNNMGVDRFIENLLSKVYSIEWYVLSKIIISKVCFIESTFSRKSPLVLTIRSKYGVFHTYYRTFSNN